MTPERWREIERLYHEARKRAPAEREAFLRGTCAGDEPLRAEVASLLAHREAAAAFMERPADVLPPPAPAAEDASDEPSSDLERPAGLLDRWPWWVWCCSLVALVAAAALGRVILTGPQPVGWLLTPASDGGTNLVVRVTEVVPGSAAERAGLQLNDVLSAPELARFLERPEPYASYRLGVVRRGERKVLTLSVGRKDWRYWSGNVGGRRLTAPLIAMLYLALAGVLLFSRPHDRAARWGALLLGQVAFLLLWGTLAPLDLSPDTARALRALPLPVGGAALLALSISAMVPAGAFGFCTAFPRPLPLGRGFWRLFLLAPAATISLHVDWLWRPVYGDPGPRVVPAGVLVVGCILGLIFLAWALRLLVRNYRTIEDRNERRRLRIVVVGFGCTFLGVAIDVLISPLPLALRTWFSSGFRWVFVLCLFAPGAICTAYAILRHRVFDIPVIIRLGLRYAVARGALLSVVPIAGLLLGADVVMHRSQPLGAILAERGLLYLAVGGGALILHMKQKSWMAALDRRFFRERYDAYRLLGTVADAVRRSATFEEASRHVAVRIDGALHPEWVSLVVRQPGEHTYRTAAAVNAPEPSIRTDSRVVGLARVLNKPLENAQSGTGWLAEQLPRGEAEQLRRARLEWLFPVLLGDRGPEAFLLLGPKRSEEPYSREDRTLLGAIAASLGLLLERPAIPASPGGFAECPDCGTCYEAGAGRCATDGGTLTKSPFSRTLAGRYRLDRRLGRGGMGSVYDATDTVLERRVAVKVMRPEWLDSPDAVARFKREAKAAASFSHRHVVTVHDFGVDESERAFLVMELLEGGTLRDELRERGRFEPARTLEILRGVGTAVESAHQRRLLHRDLKPENIFLARSDEGEVAKVLDFGLVKRLTPGQTATVAATGPGGLIGTLPYMAPEQLAGDTPAESWDIWALTVTAFEMITGVNPFALAGDPRFALAGGAAVASRAASAATLSPPVVAFFDRAFSPDRASRPASVRAFLEGLEAALTSSR
jgi:tRNA A-37 threonylcarbamoyl transferase component Bud32